MSRGISGLISRVRSRGFLFLVGIAFNRVVPPWLFRFQVFRIYRLKPPKSGDVQDEYQSDHVFQIAKADEIDDAARVTASMPPPDAVAWIAKNNSDTIGGLWLASTCFNEPELGLRFQLSDNTRWLYSARVARSHRRRGVYRSLLAAVLNSDSEKQFAAAINPLNLASARAHRSFVDQELGRYAVARFLGMSICLSARGIKPNRRISWRCGFDPIVISIACDER
ncbi:hypothetical protein [Stieleria varia]|uniref:N-acetyltransferase domain-containing protein n=1 Tax=Stieleria varia TaxID=2528005 RepID=A0A5C6A352_9BACT|nr:hypothetical protein [Stieleria varia]TWT93795.1 hypothetical protein Pla52n_56230 [Stieleria varia]